MPFESTTWLSLQGAGVAMSAIGAYAGAAARKQAMQFEAQMAEINAVSSERTAQATLLAGQHEEQRSMLATANLKSTQTAKLASSGVDLGEGSAARVLATTDIMGQIDANTIAANATRTAWGYRTQGTNFKNEASMKRSAAGGMNPGLAAGTTLLTGANAVASNWYMLQKQGAFHRNSFGPVLDKFYEGTGRSGD